MIVSILNQLLGTAATRQAGGQAAVPGNGFGIKKLSGQKVGPSGLGFEHANRR